jgi:hypothetical protein
MKKNLPTTLEEENTELQTPSSSSETLFPTAPTTTSKEEDIRELMPSSCEILFPAELLRSRTTIFSAPYNSDTE